STPRGTTLLSLSQGWELHRGAARRPVTWARARGAAKGNSVVFLSVERKTTLFPFTLVSIIMLVLVAPRPRAEVGVVVNPFLLVLAQAGEALLMEEIGRAHV